MTAPADQLSAVARLIERYRYPLLALCVAVVLAGFNGQWRIGVDSSAYRGLADALASGRGYHFGEFASSTIYPGLPLLLAAAQKAFGLSLWSPWQSILMILCMGLAALVVVYRLIRLHYPAWVATAVTCGLAINARFAVLCHDLLTDVPFLLGLVTAVYAWELLRRAESRGAIVRAVILAGGGLLLAASMRPTFWILAVAWITVSGWNFLRRRERNAGLALAVLAVVIAVVFTLDPRTRLWRIFEGGYEQEFFGVLSDPGAEYDTRAPGLFARLERNIPKLIAHNFPEAFLGQEFPLGGNYFISAVLLIGSALLFRRHPLWALLVFLTIVITVMLSTTPRYYLMVMPFLLLVWLKYCDWLRFGSTGAWGNLVLAWGLIFVSGMNLAKIAPFIVEQRTMPFRENYKRGEYEPVIAMAAVVREHVPAGAKVIGPEGTVMSFVSGREVMMQRELLPPRKSPLLYPKLLAERGIEFGIFPAGVYRAGDPDIAKMIERRIIRPTETLGSASEMTLAKIAVDVPDEPDWRKLPVYVPKPPPTTAQVRRMQRERKAAIAERRAAAERRAQAAERAARQAAAEARAEKLRRQQAAEARARKEAALAKAQREQKAAARAAREARQRREAALAKAERLRKQEAAQAKLRKAAAEARAAKLRKERKAQQSTTQPSTQPTTAPTSLGTDAPDWAFPAGARAGGAVRAAKSSAIHRAPPGAPMAICSTWSNDRIFRNSLINIY